MSVGEPVGTSFIEEVNVFDQEAEERNNNLEGKKGTYDYTTATIDQKINKIKNATKSSCLIGGHLRVIVTVRLH